MFFFATLLVIVSGLTHAIWNLFTKQSMNKAVFLWSVHIIAFVIYLPFLIVWLTDSRLDFMGSLVIIITMCFHASYFLLITKTYSIGEFSQVYPMMRGTGAFLIPITSVVLFQDHLSLLGWLGVIIINIGLIFLSDLRINKNRIPKRVIILALSVGLCITCYVLSDNFALHYVSPFVLAEFQNIAYILALAWETFHSGQLKKEWKMNYKTIFLGSILVPGSYLLFMLAMDRTGVAQMAPIREIGIVFGTFFGVFILKEKQGQKRIISSGVILLGIVILAVFGKI